jgi:hypothetical protein
MGAVLRFKSCFANLLVDAAAAAVDGAVLGCHDNLQRSLILYIPCKSGQFRNSDNHLGRK